ncbi:MAG: transposase [Lentisphaerae bacterium]|nr:transposase [Lentisphaerota bacterium]MCP4100814.1 transposase [Lentisphaerota bacterium]
MLKGILWLLKSGARWRDMLKEKLPPYQTCNRRFQEWINAGVFQSVLGRIVKDFKNFYLSGCFIDGTSSSTIKEATASAKQSRKWFKNYGHWRCCRFTCLCLCGKRFASRNHACRGSDR